MKSKINYCYRKDLYRKNIDDYTYEQLVNFNTDFIIELKRRKESKLGYIESYMNNDEKIKYMNYLRNEKLNKIKNKLK